MKTLPHDGQARCTAAPAPTDPARLRERALIERCLAGDRHAWNNLVEMHQGMLYRFAYSLCRNHEEAGDIVGQVMMRVYQNLHTYRMEGSFTSWLLSIVRHTFLDLCIRPNRSLTFSLDSGGFEGSPCLREIPALGPSPEAIVITTETARQLSRAVLNLPAYQRQVLQMYYAQGKTYSEIAEAMGLSIGTVKSRLNRARTMLRARLDPFYDLAAA